MNSEQFHDLKQFILATIFQSEQRMMERMDGMDQRFDAIDQRFEEVIDGMNQQTETIIDHFDKGITSSNARVDDYEERITRLERHVA